MRLLVRQVGGGLGEAVLAAAVATVVAAVGLAAFATVHWPAFNSSHVTRALTTVGQVVAVAVLVVAAVLIRRGSRPWLSKVLSWVGISGFVTITLGMPLAATKLYLLGISVDQEFRTEYLTRLTDSAALHDMTYADLPPYYPAGWFWLGGRVANLLGMPGWEVFKPYAITGVAVAAALALVLWNKLIRSDWAIAVAAATTAVTVSFAAPEPYSAVLVILFAPVMLLAWGALYRPIPKTPLDAPAQPAPPNSGGWGAVIGTGLFLGVSAMFYQLFAGAAVFAVVLMAVVAWLTTVRRHRLDRTVTDPGALRLLWPIFLRLAVMGVITAVLALVTWGPWLLRALTAAPSESGTALHYLPEPGSQLPFPMFDPHQPLLALLYLIGAVWLLVRTGSSRRAQALSISVVSIYLWSLASLAATALGTTALAFRLDPILQVLLAAAGAFGFVEGARATYQALNEPRRFRTVSMAIAVLGALAFAQGIPGILSNEITPAYTDTDGNGHRADERSPSSVSHYRAIDAALTAQTGRPRHDLVVLTTDTSFLSYYPYYGFQGLTSHYANPLADFAARSDEIARWSTLDSPTQLIDALDHAPWRAPDAFLFRSDGDAYTVRLAADAYPNDPNVRRYSVAFPKPLFADPHFHATQVGPYTLIVRR